MAMLRGAIAATFLFAVLGAPAPASAQQDTPAEATPDPANPNVDIVPLPLTGPAYLLAEEALEALGEGDQQAAIDKAREAIRLRPDVARLTYILIEALIEAGRSDEAQALIERTLAERPEDQRLLDMRAALQPQPGKPTADYLAAEAAYAAYDKGDYARAVAQAERAVALAPDNAAYRKLLADSRAALAASRPSPAFLAAKAAYAALGMRRYQDAVSDARDAVRLAPGNRDYRLLLADALAGAGENAEALEVLSQLSGQTRYDVASRQAASEAALEDWSAAAASYRAARLAAPGKKARAAMAAGEIRALAASGQTDEAAALFDEAEADGDLAALSNLDRAFTTTAVQRDAVALQAFNAARANGQLRGATNFDAAYAAKRSYENAVAIDYFKTGIDAAVADGEDINDPALFAIRRDVSDLTRVWGAYLTLNHAPLGAAQTASGAPAFSGGSAITQFGAEVFWRPPKIGYRNGATFEFFARDFITLHDESGGPTGWSTQQAMVGARWKPLQNWNLVFEAARLIKLGSNARNDTLVRAAFSEGQGTDLRVDVPSWWMWQVYGEVDYYIDNPQLIVLSEARAGRSFRLDGLSDRLVVTPFLGVSQSYDDSLADPGALGAGPGLSLRYWFREDRYNAPRSYVDANIRYHVKVAGDDRAEGLFGGITFHY